MVIELPSFKGPKTFSSVNIWDLSFFYLASDLWKVTFSLDQSRMDFAEIKNKQTNKYQHF